MRTVFFLLTMAFAASSCATRDLHYSKTLSKQTVMMGCLNPGPAPDSYVLTDYKTGKPVQVTGHGQLPLHASNHAVKLVGIYQAETGWEGLRVISLDHIANSCSTPFPANLPGRAAQHVTE
jgi:hypothetical protein